MSIQEMWRWLVAWDQWGQLTRTLVEIIIIILALWALTRLLSTVVDRTFNLTARRIESEEQINRAKTLRGLLQSALRYVMTFVAAMTVLPLLGIPTAQFLAGAGVLGLAVGFGAQNLVRDVITGFFLLYEDQFTLGDFVDLGGTTGIIDDMGIRTTRVRDFGGQLHFLPNGTIEKVTNFSRGPMRALVHVDIAYEEDVERAIAVLEELCEELACSLPNVLEGPRVLGISSFKESSISLMIWARAANMTQWATEREILRHVKQRFKEKNIEIPYPRRVVVPASTTKILNQSSSLNEGSETDS